MNQIKRFLRLLKDTIFSTRAASAYMLLFAISIGVATFVENDFGTSAAQKVIFKSLWFEILLVLFGLTIVVNISRFNLIKQKKWASLIFHSAIILIIIGAGVTRYFGYEGMMHIREGDSSNEFLSSETYLNYQVLMNDKSYSFDEKVLFAPLGSNKFKQSYQIGDKLIETELLEFIPNPIGKMKEDPSGIAMVKIVIAGGRGREEYHVKMGDRTNLNGLKFNFGGPELPGYVNILYRNDSLLFKLEQPVTQMVMATQKLDTIYPGVNYNMLRTRSLYSMGSSNFVIAEFSKSAKLTTESKEVKVTNESTVGLKFLVKINGKSNNIMLLGHKGEEGEPKIIEAEGIKMAMAFGSKRIKVPFSIALRDFILERYPGTENPSSYASEVTLKDENPQYERQQRIYMNHVLDYKGYRFFQSSFDQDELGTFLSVNNDLWGTWISYIGYILLTIGLILIFFLPKTRFQYLMTRLKKYQKQASIIMLLLVSSSFQIFAQSTTNAPVAIVSLEHASNISKTIVQDQQGRFKPLNTLASEVLRKISKKESLYGQSAEQIFLSMAISPQTWEDVAIIYTGNHPKILELLDVQEGLISYHSFFDEGGSYKLKDAVRAAQSMNPKDQGTFEKALIKLDERLNIANMVLAARMLRILPVRDDPNNTWISPAEVSDLNDNNDFIANFFPSYVNELSLSFTSQNYSKPDLMLTQLRDYQRSISGNVLPSESRLKVELILNKLDVFSKLTIIYAIMGILLLLYFISSVLIPKLKNTLSLKVSFFLLGAAFLFHMIGLGMRWYVSGHAPWSNGYESMIYIAWTTMLAGLIFSRNSLGGLTATSVLAATILLVANLSYLDPEITPLVPVLKSYWLTIHVSMEAGSYGFLMLGAVIGMLNLLLFVLATSKNIENIKNSIAELTIVSEITVTGGLIMLSVGTYLGGVWANESWGRYWGWDAKETWALVTILVYAFILHMRFVPGLKSIFAYNLASLFGFASVIMTYYGVNYYLSGLHSYAAGDPVPIPPMVYYTAIVFLILGIASFVNYRRKPFDDFHI